MEEARQDAIRNVRGHGEPCDRCAVAAASAAVGLAADARSRLVATTADLERVKAPYVVPQILCDLSADLVSIERLAASRHIDYFANLRPMLCCKIVQIFSHRCDPPVSRKS
jgi:hypothetical protein